MSKRAAVLLRAPEGHEPAIRAGLVLLRLWHRQAHGLHRSWIVWQTLAKYPPENPRVRGVIWDPRSAAAAVTDADRYLRVFEAMLDEARWMELQDEAATIAIPPLPATQAIGVDGESFGLERPNSMHGARLEWWGDGPPEWAPLAAWFDRVIAFCDGALAAPPVNEPSSPPPRSGGPRRRW